MKVKPTGTAHSAVEVPTRVAPGELGRQGSELGCKVVALYQRWAASHPQFSSRMSFNFKPEAVPSGNATAIEVPKAGIESFGANTRPPVAISINGHRWRSRIAVKGGKYLVGISAANRAASSISEGDLVEVLIELDEEPR